MMIVDVPDVELSLGLLSEGVEGLLDVLAVLGADREVGHVAVIPAPRLGLGLRHLSLLLQVRLHAIIFSVICFTYTTTTRSCAV